MLSFSMLSRAPGQLPLRYRRALRWKRRLLATQCCCWGRGCERSSKKLSSKVAQPSLAGI